MAIHAAVHFYDLAVPFIKELPDNPEKRDDFLNQPRNIGRLIAVATNLSFAIELLLKGLAIKTKGKAINKHQLIELFNDIPKWVQDEIDARYRYRFARRNMATFHPISIVVSKDPLLPGDLRKKMHILTGTDEEDVRKLLRRERDAFQTWRYVYEEIPATDCTAVTVHLWHLAFLVKAINDVLTLPEKRP